MVAHSAGQLRRGQYNKTTIHREIPVAKCAQPRHGRKRACPRKLPAAAVVKIAKVTRLRASWAISRDKCGGSPITTKSTTRTAPRPKVIDAADPKTIPIKTVNGRISSGSYTLARWHGLL